MLLPVNFGYSWNDEALSLYIHGASEGKKVSMIRENLTLSQFFRVTNVEF
ncbi:Pyridoxamine 5'-phosphate oxidase [Lactococcus cremoris]|nr:Pyridoxamine 5'-phosphate oxidase [Lactococcus cremoris]KZK36840.1 Pyridoxamine 5'-phosphate oxidase [Lactococcus cremoris]KZK49829.1 Pyridoxamine 5'-phosphate oxidase [Lactococcus cremoris]